MAYRHEVFAPPPLSPKIMTFAGIAAEGLDVLVHPLQTVANIQQSLVAGGGIFLATQIARKR